jgi:hypothetical protein
LVSRLDYGSQEECGVSIVNPLKKTVTGLARLSSAWRCH